MVSITKDVREWLPIRVLVDSLIEDDRIRENHRNPGFTQFFRVLRECTGNECEHHSTTRPKVAVLRIAATPFKMHEFHSGMIQPELLSYNHTT